MPFAFVAEPWAHPICGRVAESVIAAPLSLSAGCHHVRATEAKPGHTWFGIQPSDVQQLMRASDD